MTYRMGVVGLGVMGASLARNIESKGFPVAGYDVEAAKTKAFLDGPAKGTAIIGVERPEDLMAAVERPRRVLMMVPAGPAVDSVIAHLRPHLEPGDILIDGGNSNFRDSKRRHQTAQSRGVHFVDVGVSGGVWGLRVGFALMAGGDEEAVSRLEPLFKSLAPEEGWAHVGPSGAGHFVKMVHNGIEYGMMQAYAEGFELMHHSTYPLDLTQIAGIWRHGSVVRSWLLDLLYEAFEEHGATLEDIAGYVEDSGEGRWTINEAIEAAVPVPVIASSLFARFSSRRDINFAAKVSAALRNQFGGHAVRAAKQEKARK